MICTVFSETVPGQARDDVTIRTAVTIETQGKPRACLKSSFSLCGRYVVFVSLSAVYTPHEFYKTIIDLS